MTTTTSRRALIKAAPLTAAALAIPMAALAAPADRTAWNAAMAALTKAKADEAGFDDAELTRSYEAWKAGQPSMDTIHWERLPFVDRDHTARCWDLDKAWTRYLQGEGKWWGGAGPASTELMKQKYRAALDSIQAFRDAEAKNGRDSGYDAACDRSEALGEACNAAMDAVMETPAPDTAALRWKLAYLLADDGTESTCAFSKDFVAQTVADIARLLPKGA